ncbi:MAG TPA: hypothetical protein VHY32_05970 [Caulobacteraceae bacterium]|jgi:hypothetical protein|nr:hypothetical protein [Caulobacteraceae bacterium]
MRHYSWSIQSAHSSGVETPAAIGEKYIRMLDRFSQIDPVLSGWSIWQDNCTLDELEAWAEKGMPEPAPVRAVPLDEARRDMTAFVEANAQLDDWGEPQPDEGYGLLAHNKYNLTARNVSVMVKAGSKSDFNNWRVDFGEVGDPPDPSILTYPIMGGIFRAMIPIWPTPWAIVQGSTAEYEKRREERRGYIGTTNVETFRHDIAWMGYLSAELAPGFEPPADLISERTADGVLMISAEARPDPADPDQMRRGDLLKAIMDKHFPNR